MAENKNKYSQEAEQLIKDFFGSTEMAMKWVKANGLYEEARLYLLDMEKAQNRSDFNDAKLSFKKNIVRPFYEQIIAPTDENVRQSFLKANPIMDFMSPKGLGAYDDIKKNEKVQNSKYATVTENKKGEKVVNVPLLQMINDPGELSDLARYLEVDAEELRDHILNEWDKKKKKEWAAEEKAMKQEVIANRNKIANDYANSWYGNVINAIAPETTAKTLEEIRSGKDFGQEAENKAIIQDALVGLGTIYSGEVAGSALRYAPRVASKVLNTKPAKAFGKFVNENVLKKLGFSPLALSDLVKYKANMVLKNPATQAVAGGAVDAGIEAYRQGVSDYYEFDPQTIARVGSVSATMPAAVGAATSFASGIPFMGRITRPLTRRLREMQPKPGDEEFLKNGKIYNDARKAVKDAKNTKDPVKEVKANDKLNEVMEFVNNSPYTKLGKEKSFKDIKKLVNDPQKASKYFIPPTEEEVNKAYKKMRSSKKDVSDNAEEWLNRVKSQWGANYNEIMNGPEPMPFADKVGTILTDLASREETQRSRTTGKMKGVPSENLRYVMENDPLTIRTWENGFAPHDNSLMEVYKEWKEKFGGRR